ncbi:RNA polymerase sporulation sigma factor SigK [Aminipila luticellarii]|uniref:RNA polymerase sigma factor n=1 Tax=Aminipila luticellarii TaxID=2507160 RepID=A0A410PVX2_9FIRM|nr:RNA polymerase sporulation sigma factor SigK [Aminipila luticellarii]QAT43064.1 RNA polymerase sporulation sigma factor SigK [Aminipila luticellarii]
MGSSFPKPLTCKEEEYYLKRFEEGDLEAKNTLIVRNLRLVAHIVKKYSGGNTNPDDLISIGTIGLIKAINTYSSKRATRLATYAAKCIENEILMSIRSEKKRKLEISLNEPIGTDKDGNEINFNDILGSDPDAVLNDIHLKLQIKSLYGAISHILTNRERLIVMKRYGISGEEPLTQRELAKELGISRSYVSRIEKKAVGKLRDYLKP